MTTNTTDTTTTLLEQMNVSSTTTATVDRSTAAAVPVPPVKLFVKRDYLRSHERAIQQLWQDHHVFESDAPSLLTEKAPSRGDDDESFLVTFPYPYMNGVLHIGHAFSFSKALFRSMYERLQPHHQNSTLLPFAFHCTGMPIQAVTWILCTWCIYLNE